jgi:CBS domain-containing protein
MATSSIGKIMAEKLVTIEAISSVEAAIDVMTQNKVRHLLVVEDEDIIKPS